MPAASGPEPARDRLIAHGARALADEELLAILLDGGRGRSRLPDAAGALASRHPDGGLFRLSLEELRRAEGLGPAGAARVAAARELGRRWRSALEPECLQDPEEVARELSWLERERKEHFVGLYLDAANRLIHRETVSVGTLTASLVHPREVFAPALERRAASVVVAHNHPSGVSRPSSEDRQTTSRLEEAGRILGVPLLDHVIVAAGGHFSFRRAGMLS